MTKNLDVVALANDRRVAEVAFATRTWREVLATSADRLPDDGALTAARRSVATAELRDGHLQDLRSLEAHVSALYARRGDADLSPDQVMGIAARAFALQGRADATGVAELAVPAGLALSVEQQALRHLPVSDIATRVADHHDWAARTSQSVSVARAQVTVRELHAVADHHRGPDGLFSQVSPLVMAQREHDTGMAHASVETGSSLPPVAQRPFGRLVSATKQALGVRSTGARSAA